MGRRFRARRLTRALGAEIDGVDLHPPLDADEVAGVHAALIEHQVLSFHDQELTDEDQLDAALVPPTRPR